MKLRTRLALTLAAVSVPLVASAQWLRSDVEQRAAVTSLADFARARMETGGREQCEASPSTFRDPPRDHKRDRDGMRAHDDGRREPPPKREASSSMTGSESPDGNLPPSAREPSPREPPPREPPARDQSAREQSAREPPGRPPPRGRGPGDGPGFSPRVEMFAYSPDFSSANPSAPVFPADLERALESGASESGYLRDTGEKNELTAAVRMRWASGPCAIMLAWRHDNRPAVRAIDEIALRRSWPAASWSPC